MGMKCKECSCSNYHRMPVEADRLELEQRNLVSCLMVTQASRLDMARKAIACFEAQTYPWKELIIVSDDDVSALERPFVRAPQGLTLGDLRNFAIARAQSPYVAQWDDDDLYHPDRLAHQIATLIAAGPSYDGCTLSRWTLYWPAKDPTQDKTGITMRREKGWEGSIVARRFRIPCYPGIPRGEDFPVNESMKIVTLDEPHLYTYIFHGSNTWNEAHFVGIYRHAIAK
jgi:glycosyltransferase involved in cell wall biosynthesis